MQTMGDLKSSRAVASFISRPRLMLGMVIFCAGVTLLAVLYTGSPWVEGVDLFLEHARPLIDKAGYSWSYREVDPDVFGEELETEIYSHAERIAAVVLTVTRLS